MSFFVTADGGLTTAGYVGCVVLMVALVVIASVLSAQKSKGTGMDARKLAFCAMGMALAFVTSYVKVFELPYGGSVTLFSMLFILLMDCCSLSRGRMCCRCSRCAVIMCLRLRRWVWPDSLERRKTGC